MGRVGNDEVIKFAMAEVQLQILEPTDSGV